MKITFIIQGEGRGHLTQAISLAQILRSNGHAICDVLVGVNKHTELPVFFTEQFPAAKPFLSPYLVFGKKTNKLRVRKTIGKNCAKAKTYVKSMRFIHRQVKANIPDLIINFYEGLGGLYNFFYNHRNIPVVVIAHQYLLLNPKFEHPRGSWLHRSLVNLNSKLTALGADKKLALSFTPFPDIFQKQLFTVPPLLRQEVLKSGSENKAEDFLLMYVNQPSLAEEVIVWHKENPATKIRCFVTKVPREETHPNLFFHKLDAALFLTYMKRCSGVVTTAGFETICEAMFFQKPVLMIPLKNHYEQRCNALDAVRAGAGITQTDFNLSRFLAYVRDDFTPDTSFTAWANSAEEIILEELEEFEPKKADAYKVNLDQVGLGRL